MDKFNVSRNYEATLNLQVLDSNISDGQVDVSWDGLSGRNT